MNFLSAPGAVPNQEAGFASDWSEAPGQKLQSTKYEK